MFVFERQNVGWGARVQTCQKCSNNGAAYLFIFVLLGDQGEKGAPGERGNMGPPGPEGRPGVPGIDGMKGKLVVGQLSSALHSVLSSSVLTWSEQIQQGGSVCRQDRQVIT